MTVKPLFNQVHFKNVRNREGIIQLTGAPQGDVHGLVLAVGPDCKTIKVGDRILPGTKDLLEFPWSGEPLYICPETSVVALVEADQPQEERL